MADVMTEFENRVAQAQQMILVGLLAEHADERLGKVLDAFEDNVRDLFFETSLRSLVEVYLEHQAHAEANPPSPTPPKPARRRKKPPTNGARKPKAKKTAKKKAKRKAKGNNKGNGKAKKTKAAAAKTSTPKNGAPAPVETTEVIDAKVLQALRSKSDPSSKEDVLTATGISKSQFRTSSHRLLEAGKIHRSGTTRGTRYKAA
jgi:hypothetical protein